MTKRLEMLGDAGGVSPNISKDIGSFKNSPI
jgi:hypothetical protein